MTAAGESGCKEHQGRQKVPNSQKSAEPQNCPIRENEVLPSTCLSRTRSIHTSACELTWPHRLTCMHSPMSTHAHTTYAVRLAGSFSQACRPIPIKFLHTLSKAGALGQDAPRLGSVLDKDADLPSSLWTGTNHHQLRKNRKSTAGTERHISSHIIYMCNLKK